MCIRDSIESLKVSGSDRTRLIEKCERIIMGKYETPYNRLRGYGIRIWYYDPESRGEYVYVDGEIGDIVVDWHLLDDYDIGSKL